jgi:hypothetical protein
MTGLVRQTVKLSRVLSRSYVAPVRTWTPRVAALPKPLAAQAAKSSTKVESNTDPVPEIIGTLPNVSAEIKLPEELVEPAFFDQATPNGGSFIDWSKSYQGLSTQAFSKEIAEVLLAPLDPMDIEMKPGTWMFP